MASEQDGLRVAVCASLRYGAADVALIAYGARNKTMPKMRSAFAVEVDSSAAKTLWGDQVSNTWSRLGAET